MKKTVLLILLSSFLFSGCLKTKKSSFDIRSPAGFFFGFFLANSTFSVSGTITGFSSGTLILQNNGKNDLTLTAPATQYSFSGISSGTAYSILPKSHPAGLSCKIENLKGTVTGNITNANITCSESKANALYSLGDTSKSYWMDYIKSDGSSPINATGTTCTGSETGYYNACIHAGEFKKVAIPNITSCDGITAADSLSAFYWNCFVGTDSSVSVISTGLRGDKGLSDLIDFTSPGSWRSNTVTVSYNGITHLTTSAGKWWDNTITVNNTGGGLSTSKTVYIINDGSSAVDYRINTVGTNKIALLVQPGILKPLTAGTTAINVTDNSFLWIEGNFRAVTSNAVLISFQSSGGTNKFNVLRKFKGIGNGGYVIANNASSASLFTNVSGTNLAATGGNFLNMNNTKNIINNFRVYNTSANGLEISQSDLIVLNSMVMNSGTISFLSNGMTYANNILINNSSLNSGSSGVSFTGGTVRPTTVNLLTANTGGATSALDVFSTSPKFINTIAAHSGGITHYADNAGTENSVFNGILKTSSASCLSSGTSPGVNSSCAKINGSETGVPSVTNISLSSSFVGQITSSDSKNTGNTNGASSFPPADWLDFENQFRGWGKQGSFPASAVTGRCSTGTCQIWDLSLKSSDTAARNVNACPSGTAVDTHIWSDASAGSQAYCDANYKGSKLNGTTCVTAFLRNAVEIFGDGIGNENGICESGEDCLYTPNIGIYQGHSSDSSNPYKLVKANTVSSANTNLCSDIGSGGTITNVTLWKYDTNGY